MLWNEAATLATTFATSICNKDSDLRLEGKVIWSTQWPVYKDS